MPLLFQMYAHFYYCVQTSCLQIFVSSGVRVNLLSPEIVVLEALSLFLTVCLVSFCIGGAVFLLPGGMTTIPIIPNFTLLFN